MANSGVPDKLLELDILVGGMGVDISGIELVSIAANYPGGRVSGSLSATGLTDAYARLLQLGDDEGEVREAFDACIRVAPALADDVDRLYSSYHIPGGKAPQARFRGFSMAGTTAPRDVQVFTVAATFAHVWRTKRRAPGRPIGINFLRKIERFLLPGLYGAMLADVDWVVMGAGDPSAIPGILDRLAHHESVDLPIQVATVPYGEHWTSFDPKEFIGGRAPPLRRPVFMAIVSSHLQAEALASNPQTRPDAFVVEGPAAGGHNAPPSKRGRDDNGDYIYGPEDDADLAAVATLGIPFWVAGGYGSPPDRGSAAPVLRRQVGTLFALSSDSGMDPVIRRRVLEQVWERKLDVVTSVGASPSTYPFKVARVPGTIGDRATYLARRRRCNLGYLRGWRPKDGKLVGLCPADDTGVYEKAGGAAWRTQGSMCLCNGLLATCELGQPDEAPLVTLGDTTPVRDLQMRLRRMEYSAEEAAAYVLGELERLRDSREAVPGGVSAESIAPQHGLEGVRRLLGPMA